MMLYAKRVKRVGFTLIEIMIVIAIIAILAGIVVPNFMQARQEAQLAACRKNILTIANAIEMAAARISYGGLVLRVNRTRDPNNPGLFDGWDSTVGDVIEYLLEYDYLAKEPVCSVGGSYEVTLYTEYSSGGSYVRCRRAPGVKSGAVHFIGDKRIRPQYYLTGAFTAPVDKRPDGGGCSGWGDMVFDI